MFNFSTRSKKLLMVVFLIIYLVSGITVFKKAKEKSYRIFALVSVHRND